MLPRDEWAELATHLERTTRLSAAEARKVIAEVLGYLDETVESYVRRRHGQLHGQGERNDEIYRRLREELTQHRFKAGDISERQIRRLIYG